MNSASEIPHPHKSAAAEAPEAAEGAAKVLIVEDDPCLSLLYKSILRREGYLTEQTADGEGAIKLLSQEVFDAVVLDLMMPKVDGMQVLKWMRSSPDNALTPLLIITAARLKVLEEEATRFGVRLYLEKNQTDQLITGLREIIAERSSLGPQRLRMASSVSQEKRPVSPPKEPVLAKAPEEVERPKGLTRFFRMRTSSSSAG